MSQSLSPVAVFEVQGSGVKPYTVSVYGGGNGAWCSCPSFRFQKGKPASERACKHSVKVVKFLMGGSVVPGVKQVS